jgi:hypothetical protein
MPDNLPADVEKAVATHEDSKLTSRASSEIGRDNEVTAQPSTAPLDWDSPDDPDNPWNWPMSKRWLGTIVPGALCLLVYVPSS